MRVLPSSLAGRLFVVAAALIVVTIVGAGAVTGAFLYRFVALQVDQRLDAQIGAIASALSVSPDNKLSLDPRVDTPPFDRPATGWYFEVIDGDTHFRSRSLGAAELHLPRPWFLDWLPRPAPDEGPGPEPRSLRVRNGSAAIGDRIVTIIAAAPRSAIWRPLLRAVAGAAGAGARRRRACSSPCLAASPPLACVRCARFSRRTLQRCPRRASGTPSPLDQPSEIAPLVVELNSLIADNGGASRARAATSPTSRMA